mmetsp:Transcript_52161/g.124295  ORF Transcript_52161/g.124295 Transcript_52161/m.124295 type:complete len:402 (-) Transcript_52161:131-1336(-)
MEDGAEDAPAARISQPLRSESEIVIGLPMHDLSMVKTTRRVIILAAATAAWCICYFIANRLGGSRSSNDSGDMWTAITTLFIHLSIPACGYYGAVHTNRQLTCCFCSCNLFFTILTVIAFIRSEIRVGELGGDCSKEHDQEKREQCELMVGNSAEKYIMLCRTIIVVCFGCLAFWFGNALYQRLAQDAGAASSQLVVVGDPLLVGSRDGDGAASPGAARAPRPGHRRHVGASATADSSGNSPLDPELAAWVARAIANAYASQRGNGGRGSGVTGWGPQASPTHAAGSTSTTVWPSWVTQVLDGWRDRLTQGPVGPEISPAPAPTEDQGAGTANIAGTNVNAEEPSDVEMQHSPVQVADEAEARGGVAVTVLEPSHPEGDGSADANNTSSSLRTAEPITHRL